MLNRQFPMITITGRQNIEKMDLIYNHLKKQGYGSWSKFVSQAIEEKWHRELFNTLKKEHGVYSPLIQIMENVYDYKTFHRHGMSFQNAFKAGAINIKDLESFYSSLEFIKNNILSPEVEKELFKGKLNMLNT